MLANIDFSAVTVFYFTSKGATLSQNLMDLGKSPIKRNNDFPKVC